MSADLKRRRAELGFSQEALAHFAGVDRTFVSQIERGVGNPSLRILCRLADQLQTTVAEMLTVRRAGDPATDSDLKRAPLDPDA